MKARETRQKTIIAARIRAGNAWCDGHILNLSSRGLLIHAAPPPARGAYVEVRRGAHVIVGKVIWAKEDRFGVQTQDLVAVNALVANDLPDTPLVDDGSEAIVDQRGRHRTERLERRHAQSRETARALELAGIAGSGLGLAVLAYLLAAETLSRPLSEVAMYLGTR